MFDRLAAPFKSNCVFEMGRCVSMYDRKVAIFDMDNIPIANSLHV